MGRLAREIAVRMTHLADRHHAALANLVAWLSLEVFGGSLPPGATSHPQCLVALGKYYSLEGAEFNCFERE
ncbi:MAG: hypothetical protein SFV81_06095 [Pirellulaceae bacterium]|nr:hypothetical protein [Pirellulaceae bacterium]